MLPRIATTRKGKQTYPARRCTTTVLPCRPRLRSRHLCTSCQGDIGRYNMFQQLSHGGGAHPATPGLTALTDRCSVLLYSNPGGPRSVMAVLRLKVSVGTSKPRGALAFSAPSSIPQYVLTRSSRVYSAVRCVGSPQLAVGIGLP